MTSELEAVEDDRAPWLTLVDVLSRSFAAPRILPVDQGKAHAILLQLRVTAGSPLGAIAFNSGGILLYDGWLRILGGSPCLEERLPSIGQVNDFPAHVDRMWTPTEGLIVAHDVLGGIFFLNGLRPGSGRPGVPGEIIYFDPSTLNWARTGMSHSEWLAWCVSGDLPHFYEGRLWPSWRRDVMVLRADQGIAVSPPLWSDRTAAAGGECARAVVPMDEILAAQFDAARQRGRRVDGAMGRYPAVDG
ncbi:DUF2625 family protein [Actinoplanes sp. NPDC048796]|uniref:DUF2625 family protein n=1 Tax=unclassified Actinoplanes TaxID=2626549 RepID=UPI0033CF7B60